METNQLSHMGNARNPWITPRHFPNRLFITFVRGLSLVVLLVIATSGFAVNFESFVNPPDTLKFEPVENSKDTVEYELIIIDPAFDTWFFKNRRPMDFYTESYLESWNSQLVPQWNAALGSTRHRNCAPTTYLDYRFDIKYGKELNYKLFYYFMYIQQSCRIFTHTPRAW